LDWFTPGAGFLAAGEYAGGLRLAQNARQKGDKQTPIRRAWMAFNEGLARPVGLACEHLPHLYAKLSWTWCGSRHPETAPGNITLNLLAKLLLEY